ncbi:hypothetical protein I4641_15740 [Waterburya agarophytonicola K14]|uniref:Uncharacterized protein n=1 Tax=Waterburya agarophytonicola KI4 TaxID=2874699 RepID=A0A964BRS4_9CYAN|nr:hypothetical protein [Waterburya agarophytonicola]MCC0178429.1 hypothetical protein [Waterburya agarophytonicola KI4]
MNKNKNKSYKLISVLKKVLKTIGSVILYIIGIIFSLLMTYVIFYLCFWKGGIWLIVKLSSFNYKDPIPGRTVGLIISTFGVVLAIVIRRWFSALDLARSIDLVEAHRNAIVENPNCIMPNAIFPSDLKELCRFLSSEATLQIISIAKVCEIIYELAAEEGTDVDKKISKLIEDYLQNKSLKKTSKFLRSPMTPLLIFTFKDSKLSEEDLFANQLRI